MPVKPSLQSLSICFQGLIPSYIATCADDGTPNITLLSQVHYVDRNHVALSCQFFNKTRKNIAVNPWACVEVLDPRTLGTFRLHLRYSHSETEGGVFDAMAMRISAIASLTGMEGIFRLLSADVYEVLELEELAGFVQPQGDQEKLEPEFALRQVLGIQIVSQQLNATRELDEALQVLLKTLDEVCGFDHSMLMVPDESGQRLYALASRGYGDAGGAGVGAEVAMGEGFIGTVAEQRKVLRVSGISNELRYGRAIRARVQHEGGAALSPEIALPGLPDVQSQLALPLVLQDRLMGVLALESRDPFAFSTWDEALLQILANQIAVTLDRNAGKDEEDALAPISKTTIEAPQLLDRRRTFTFFRNDDCVFVDGEYLIRNIPGKILWKLLTAFKREGRQDFSNRELRLDPSLGLPTVKNNLESRLILLRKRLEQQCPEVRIVPVRRGRFALEVNTAIELIEKDSA